MTTPAAAPRSATSNDDATDQDMTQDLAKVKSFVRDRIQHDVKANTPRHARDRADLEALRMYRGGEDNHWSVWDPNTETYVARPRGGNDDAALPPWFFRPTTNLFGVKTDGICSLLNQSDPAQEYAGAHDTDSDRATAEIAEHALPVLLEECDYKALRPHLHKLIALTHAAALHLYYDNDERHGMADLPLLQCSNPACQQFQLPHDIPSDGDGANLCPECNQPTMGDAVYPPGHQQEGQPVTMPAPRGKMCARLLSSFEFSTPRSTRELHEKRVPWIAGHGRMAPHEITSLWGDAGRAALQDTKPKDGAGAKTESTTFADQMKALSAPTAAADAPVRGGTGVTAVGPVVWLVWADPIVDDEYQFPDGLYAAVLEDETVLEAGPLPFKDDQGRPFKNVLLRTYQASPGSGWGKPPSDDMVPLQKQLNLAQALAFLILMNDAAPTTWIPDTVTVLGDLSGAPGSVHQFKSLRAGDRPFVEQGKGFPESLKWFIEWIESKFEDVSKLNAVLMGARPEGGDPTAFEVEVLQDRGLAAFKEPLDALVDFEIRLSQQLLWISRQCMWSARYYAIAGDDGDWQVKEFFGADLEGAVTITVEPASAWPTSTLLRNMRLDKAIKAGVINPADPEVQETYLSLNDLTDFRKSLSADEAQVARQLKVWKQAQDPAQIGPPDPLWNLPYHFFRKVNWLKTETAEQLASENPAVYQAIRAHLQQIQLLMMPVAAPPQPGQEGGGPPDGHAVSSAVASGAIKPAPAAGAPPSGATLSHLVHRGVLQPAPMPVGAAH